MHRLIVIFFLLLVTKPLLAQQAATPYDAITYDLLMAEQWSELINASEKAIDEGYNRDYLYMRAGYGYFMKGNYMQSAWYYQQALKRCEDSTLQQSILYYLYFTHLYSGQYIAALKYTAQMNNETRKAAMAESPAYVHLWNAEAGIKLSSNQSLYKNMFYFLGGAGFRISRATTGYLSLARLSQETYYGTLAQNQLYGSLQFSMRQHWNISPAIHIIDYAYSNLTSGLSETDFKGTPVVMSVSADKNYKQWNARATTTYSNLNKSTQLQQQLAINWFPYGNNRWQLGGSVAYLHDDQKGYVLGGFNTRYWIADKLAVYGHYLYANSRNFSEQNGWLVTNAYDITHYRIQVGIEKPFTKTLSVYMMYQYESKTESYTNTDYSFSMPLIGLKLIK